MFKFRFILPLLAWFLCSAWTHGSATAPSVSCNFVTGIATGVGAGTCVSVLPTCNGVTNTEASFTAFNTWATATWQASHTGLIELYIPPSTNCTLNTFGVTFAGIKKLRITAYGATLSGDYFHLGGLGQAANSLHSTRLNTVATGATSVTVNPTSPSQPSACNSNATCTALFTVGEYAIIYGMDLQTGSGYPSNPAFFQYLRVTALDASTGIVSFDTPLDHEYKSTWPTYYTGSGTDHGGPATLAFWPDWNVEIEWRGITFDTQHQLDAPGRIIVFRDTTFNGNGIQCPAPTMTYSTTYINTNAANCTMEMDKFNELVTFTNTIEDQLSFQSMGSAKHFTKSGGSARNVIGTPLNFTLSNTSISGYLLAGATTHGFTKSITATNSSIVSLGDTTFHVSSGVVTSGFPCPAAVCPGFQNTTGISMSAGVITIPNTVVTATSGSTGWATPGANICWADANYSCSQLGQITDLTQDATNTYIVTTGMGSTFPPDWGWSLGKLILRVHPALQVSFNGITGGVEAVMLNDAAAQGKPLFSYLNQTYVNANTAGYPYFPMWGALQTMDATVNSVYAGAFSPTIVPNTLFSNYFDTSGGLVAYTPATINLKTGAAQTRSMNTSGVWSNGQSGDTLTNRSQVLWAPTLYRSSGLDISGDPSHPMSVTIKVVTDQGVVVPP